MKTTYAIETILHIGPAAGLKVTKVMNDNINCYEIPRPLIKQLLTNRKLGREWDIQELKKQNGTGIYFLVSYKSLKIYVKKTNKVLSDLFSEAYEGDKKTWFTHAIFFKKEDLEQFTPDELIYLEWYFIDKIQASNLNEKNTQPNIVEPELDDDVQYKIDKYIKSINILLMESPLNLHSSEIAQDSYDDEPGYGESDRYSNNRINPRKEYIDLQRLKREQKFEDIVSSVMTHGKRKYSHESTFIDRMNQINNDHSPARKISSFSENKPTNLSPAKTLNEQPRTSMFKPSSKSNDFSKRTSLNSDRKNVFEKKLDSINPINKTSVENNPFKVEKPTMNSFVNKQSENNLFKREAPKSLFNQPHKHEPLIDFKKPKESLFDNKSTLNKDVNNIFSSKKNNDVSDAFKNIDNLFKREKPQDLFKPQEQFEMPENEYSKTNEFIAEQPRFEDYEDNSNKTTFRCDGAKAHYDDGFITLLPGSIISIILPNSEVSANKQASIRIRYSEQLEWRENGYIRLNNDNSAFVVVKKIKDIPISIATQHVNGQIGIDGREYWKDPMGKTINEIERTV